MNDHQIEDMLRRSWRPEPPDGMRDRVLRRARAELAKPKPGRVFGMSRWKLALTGIGIAIVIFTNVSDSVRQSHLSAMISGNTPAATLAKGNGSIFETRREIERMLAQSPVCSVDSKEGSL
ncbi:MAG: hypothetical protein M1133_02910 [Armatimonadetes bacterium]|nr:hypothetical protein [Armatimonadota bacterium]